MSKTVSTTETNLESDVKSTDFSSSVMFGSAIGCDRLPMDN
jgi:hypothetical protein